MRTTLWTLLTALILICLISTSVSAQDSDEAAEEGNFIIDVVLPLSLAFIMFSLGVGLTMTDFGLVLEEPKAFAIGLTNQMLVLPVIAFAIASALSLSGEMAVGLMILACCPGGVTSNILTKLAKGDTALSISYTAVVSVVAVFTLPIIIGLSMGHFMGEAAPDIDIISLGITMFLLTTIPVAIGMAIRHFYPAIASNMETLVNNAAAGLFVIIVIAAIASEWDTLMVNIGTLGPAVIILITLMLAIGYKSALLLELPAKRATTVSIESGIQNATVGITVGGLILPSIDGGLSVLSLPAGVYGVLMYLVIAPFIFWRIHTAKSIQSTSIN